jgi:hypothetical protein
VGISTVDTFTEILATSFDAWLTQTNKKWNCPRVGVTMPFIPNNKMKALRYYLDYCDLCGLSLDVSIFDAAALQAWKMHMACLKELAKMKAAGKIQPPKPLLLLENWTTWEILFTAYLSHQQSS